MIALVKIYQDQIKGLKRNLSEQEERELIARARYDKKSKELLINQYLDLVVSVSKVFQNTRFNLLEIICEGNFGLYNLIYEDLHLFDGDMDFKRYARASIRNSILKFLSRERVRQNVSLDSLSERILENGPYFMKDPKSPNPADVIQDKEKEAENEENLRRFREFVKTLDDKNRINLIMHLKGYSPDQIKEFINLNQSTQWKRRKRIFDKLRKKFTNAA